MDAYYEAPGGLLPLEWLDLPENDHRGMQVSAKYKIDPARLPSIARVEEGRKAGKRYLRADGLLDVHAGSRYLVVSQRFKDLVEEFEPGVHFFKNVEIQMLDGKPFDGQYYIFSAQQGADFLLTEMSGIKWWYHSDDPSNIGEYGPPHLQHIGPLRRDILRKNYKSSESKIFISKPQVAGMHIYIGWRARIGTGVFFSDAFYEAFVARKMRYLQVACYCTEVDVPWDEEENFGPALDWLRKHPATSEALAAEWLRTWLDRTPQL
ncbi:MAG: DUF1629 domain-containing protein [Novosphingobium sp.]